MIPVFEPDVSNEDIQAVIAALRAGEISGTFGRHLADFEREFAAWVGRRFAVATTSGTTALHLAMAALELPPGSEVLVSASTNIASALALAHNRLVTVPVDSERRTWNLDLDLLPSLVAERTRAIMPVHLFGNPVDMERLMDFARERGLLVVEDCAESHGATVRGRLSGAFGDLACFSFYANKVITTGEGGMVVTDDPALDRKLRLLRNLGFTEPRFRHEVLGFNFRMPGLQAALGLSQLRRIDSIVESKRRLADWYTRRLRSVAGLQLPHEPEGFRHVHWMYALVVEPSFGISRDELAKRLKADGIETRTFFCPMNRQPCLGGEELMRFAPCPVAEELWERGIYLPSSTRLREADVETICERIRHAPKGAGVTACASR
ncbi:MAG: DegT/DnrJ/EryC1/StrS family aminotransferase [Phycisphaerae bacterium]|nr:DegT/DnrJ/EryC1/StrS family aminotransferase [Phycisphaerae bacterium]